MAVKNLGDKEKRTITIVAVIFVISFVIPPFLSDYALKYRNDNARIKGDLEQKLGELRQNLDGIEERKEILRRYVRRYQSLVERDVISRPDTVELVKQMKTIAEERKQNATGFTFGNQILMGSDDALYTRDSTVGINIYPLELKMGMLHDLDMFMFMESLDKKVPNLSFPVKCSMVMVQDKFAVLDRENMTGTCQINWYSVNDPERNIKATGPTTDEDETETVAG